MLKALTPHVHFLRILDSSPLKRYYLQAAHMQKESSEEAGPSNLNTIPSPLNHRRQATLNSRIHFPAESQNPKTHKTSKSIADGAVVGSPKDGSSSRRRVVSVDAGNGVSKSSVRRRIPTVSLGSSAQMVASLHSNESKDSDWSTFSDEYDLCESFIGFWLGYKLTNCILAHEGKCSLHLTWTVLQSI